MRLTHYVPACLALTLTLAGNAAWAQLPDGPGKDVTARICGKCHDAEIVKGHRYGSDEWTETILKMIDLGAIGTEEQFTTALDYLVKNFGPDAPAPINVNKAPASELETSLETLEKKLALYRHLLNNWAGLTRYGSEDSEVPAPKPGEDRVVFLGDEITERWAANHKFFPGKPYFNRGIAGQTTPQMLVRFRQDVISLKPKVVVILAGTNDLAGLMGPATQGTMAENFMSMTELAKANGIRVVLASVTPVCDCYKNQTAARPQGKIIGLNGWLKDYAAESGSVYLDYYATLADGRNFKKELTVDGLLPNDAGYSVMAPLAEQAIGQALGKK